MVDNDTIERILVQLDGFISHGLDKAQSCSDVDSLAQLAYFNFDNGLGLSQIVINDINSHLTLYNSDNDAKMKLLLGLKSKLTKYFEFGDPIDDRAISNLIVYFRQPGKYNFHSHILETEDLAKNFYHYLQESDLKKHSKAVEAFDGENFLLRKYKLPLTTKVDHKSLIASLKELDENSNWDQYINYVSLSYWRNCAPTYLIPYLEKTLEYDIGLVKSAILWKILGYVLFSIEDIHNASLSFNDLFINSKNYEIVIELFKSNGIISRDGNDIGFLKQGSVDKRSKASLIAIAEGLSVCNLLKQKYTTSEQVRAIARSFNIALSSATEFKKSKNHEVWVDSIRGLFRPNQ